MTFDRSGHAPGKATFVLLIVILGIATFLRFFHLTQTPPGLYPDEAMNGNNALEALRTGDFKVFYPENNGREGLMVAFQALSLSAFGVREPWVLRVPSAAFGVLTVVGVYLLGRELFSAPAGLVAAFLLATSTWHLHFSRMGFRVILAPLLATWALACFVYSLRKSQGGNGWARPAIAGGMLFGLGFYSYISYRVMPLLFLACLPWRRTYTHFWRVTLAFTLTAFLVALPIGLYFVANPDAFFARTAGISVFDKEEPITLFVSNLASTFGMLFLDGDANWRHNYAGRSQLFWPVGLMLLAGVGLGARAAYARSSDAAAYRVLLVWTALAAVPVALSTDALPQALRSLLMVPPLILLAAQGAVSVSDVIGRRFPSRALATGLPLVVGALLVVEAWHTYFVLYAGRPEVKEYFTEQLVTIGRTIDRLPLDTPKIVVDDADGVAVRGHRMPTQPIMFITDTFDPGMAAQKNIFYVDPEDAGSAPPGPTFHLKDIPTR